MNYNAYGDFRFPRRSNSAQDIVRMRKIRNPYIETDRNTEHLVLMNREQTNILNQTAQINKENFETVKILLNQIKENMQINNLNFLPLLLYWQPFLFLY